MFQKTNTNYHIVFSLKIFKTVLSDFVKVFLTLYFLTVSNNDILALGVYNLFYVIGAFLPFWLGRNFCKTSRRLWLLRTGVILYFIYFLILITLKEHITDVPYLAGLIAGLAAGCYHSVFNSIESDSVNSTKSAKFFGNFITIRNAALIASPILFGVLISATSFTNAAIFAASIVALEIFLSFRLKDRKLPQHKKVNLAAFHQASKKEPAYRKMLANRFWAGATYSCGALSFVVTIYIIKIFSESVSLGIFTALFSAIAMIMGTLFAKVIRHKHYAKINALSCAAWAISFVVMVLDCNFTTIVIYNLFYTIAKNFLDMITDQNVINLSNHVAFKNRFKVEYFLSVDFALFLGRVISIALFLATAFVESNLIMFVFAGFIVMTGVSAVRFQWAMNRHAHSNLTARREALAYRKVE